MIEPGNGQPFELACDESGSEGEKLIGGQTDVFAHASVRISTEAAAECVREARVRIGSPAQEYKANHLLRTKHRRTLEWFFGPLGPIRGHAHVHLIDKTHLAVHRLVELLGADPDELAGPLYRDGPAVLGTEAWMSFLDSFNDVLRVRNRRGEPTSVVEFFDLVDTLRGMARAGPVRDVLDRLAAQRSHVDGLRAWRMDDPAAGPELDPMIPAIVRAVDHWSTGGPVAIVHDEQPGLTEARVARHIGADRLASLRFVDSRVDYRVQVADYLAGAARRIAQDELHGQGDPELNALVRPHVDARSIWGDDRSWARLRP